MQLSTLTDLKQTAARRVREATFPPKKLVLLHVGAMALLAMLAATVDLLLRNQLAATGGLGGMGTRTILQTARFTLQLLIPIAVPFWNVGFVWAALAISRRKSAEPATLGEGFRQFLPLLRLFALQCLLYAGLAVLAFNISTAIALMTPLGAPYLELFASMEFTTVDQLYAILADPAQSEALLRAMLPILTIGLAVSAAAIVYMFYQLRLSVYLLLDTDSRRAVLAIQNSRFLMRGHRFQLLKLDLSYWWYYLATLLISAICYADVLLPLMGVSVPLPADATYLIAYGLYWLLLLGLEYAAKDRIEVSYALFYGAVRPPQPNDRTEGPS